MAISPIKFLGATVISFNSQMGLGSSESTFSVDLVEDCAAGDVFTGQVVGAPLYFGAGAFSFGGVLTNWTVNQGGSGKTYNVKMVDPRQLLENCVVIVDSYLGSPIRSLNYFNAYAYYESSVLNGNCSAYGDSLSNERGMPYQMVINGLASMGPTIYSPTGYAYTINFSSFPQGLPAWYRVAGPSVTILQLLQDVCDVMGFDFYVTLAPGNVINIGLINLKAPPPSFNSIITSYDGIATDLSYGQELRNEVTKTVLFGEKYHYLTQVNKFNYFFGEDNINGIMQPVVPFSRDACGFMISKKVDSLNLSLNTPLPSNGPYTIHELDIRAAMASQQLWLARAMSDGIGGTFNAAVRTTWPQARVDGQGVLNSLLGAPQALGATANAVANGIPLSDGMGNSNSALVAANEQKNLQDIDKVWEFIKSLGDTFYGKQFMCILDEKICYYQTENFAEKMFSSIPTSAGGWVEAGVPVLNLSEPEISIFKEEDGRTGCFAFFDITGTPPDPLTQTDSPSQSSSYIDSGS